MRRRAGSHPKACRRCGTLLQGDDPEPHRHHVIDIPPISAQVIEHRSHRLIAPAAPPALALRCRSAWRSATCGPRLSALVGLLGSDFPVSISKAQALPDQLLGVAISSGANGLRPTASTPPSAHGWPSACSSRWRKPCGWHASSRWSTWMKPVPPRAMRMGVISMGVAVGCGC